MQQRVALARALAIEPRVLLLDEPLSALDAKVRVQLREEIRRIQLELGITTIYVTHDQEEALSISDRVAVHVGGPDRADRHAGRDLRRRPATPFVAEFIGTMNRLEATVADARAASSTTAGRALRVDAARGRAPASACSCSCGPSRSSSQPADGTTPAGDSPARSSRTRSSASVTRAEGGLGGEGELTADVPTSRVDSLPIGMRVAASFPADSARLLSLLTARAASS